MVIAGADERRLTSLRVFWKDSEITTLIVPPTETRRIRWKEEFEPLELRRDPLRDTAADCEWVLGVSPPDDGAGETCEERRAKGKTRSKVGPVLSRRSRRFGEGDGGAASATSG